MSSNKYQATIAEPDQYFLCFRWSGFKTAYEEAGFSGLALENVIGPMRHPKKPLLEDDIDKEVAKEVRKKLHKHMQKHGTISAKRIAKVIHKTLEKDALK